MKTTNKKIVLILLLISVLFAGLIACSDDSKNYSAEEKNGLYGFVNDNEEVIIDYKYDLAKDFSEGLAPVMIDDKWGYINTKDEIVIEPQFQEAGEFEDGKADVLIENEWETIGTNGKKIFRIPLGKWIENFLDWLYPVSKGTKAASAQLEKGFDALVKGLLKIPAWVTILILTAIAFKLANIKVAVMTLLGMLFLWNMELWDATVSTIMLVLISAMLSMIIGIPLGILMGLNPTFHRINTPILDFMQTMPAFVYLIPAIPFFGLGPMAGIFSTFIFSIPPVIRLTSLGIRQVPEDLIEASDAFGSTKMQKLIKVQLPVATPTIMAGINQTIMLALSMVVIAGMVGAGGLGSKVWSAIQVLDMGSGFESGVAVVIIAMVLDRISQQIAKDRKMQNQKPNPVIRFFKRLTDGNKNKKVMDKNLKKGA